MKKLAILFLSIATFIFAFSCKKNEDPGIPDMPDTGEISVLTYNVAGLPEGINADQHPTIHMQLVSPLLNAYNVVNVQEDFYYHDSLYRYINLPYKSTYYAGPGGLGDGLNTVSSIPFTGYDRVAWDSCNGTDCFTPKGFAYTRLRFNADVFVDLYNLHFNAGASPADIKARESDMKQICAYMDAHSAGNAMIVMGDFNSRYTRVGDSIRQFISKGLKDVWVELTRGGSYPLEDNIALTDCDSSIYSSPTCEVVDKIFFRSSSKITLTPTFYKLNDALYYDSTGDQLSDHRPMNAKFTYKVIR